MTGLWVSAADTEERTFIDWFIKEWRPRFYLWRSMLIPSSILEAGPWTPPPTCLVRASLFTSSRALRIWLTYAGSSCSPALGLLLGMFKLCLICLALVKFCANWVFLNLAFSNDWCTPLHILLFRGSLWMLLFLSIRLLKFEAFKFGLICYITASNLGSSSSSPMI